MAAEQAQVEAGHHDGGAEDVAGIVPQIEPTPGLPERAGRAPPQGPGHVDHRTRCRAQAQEGIIESLTPASASATACARRATAARPAEPAAAGPSESHGATSADEVASLPKRTGPAGRPTTGRSRRWCMTRTHAPGERTHPARHVGPNGPGRARPRGRPANGQSFPGAGAFGRPAGCSPWPSTSSSTPSAGPFQVREFIQQCWFFASVTILPTALVAIPFGAVIALQLGSLTSQLGAQSFTGAGQRARDHPAGRPARHRAAGRRRGRLGDLRGPRRAHHPRGDRRAWRSSASPRSSAWSCRGCSP